eukprot:6469163-Amphidinium_carterae.1
MVFVRRALRISDHRLMQSMRVSSASLAMPWWHAPETTEPALVFQSGPPMLQPGERGLMPDTGAHDNLAGVHWLRAQAQDAADHGLKSSQTQLQVPTQVQGVGHGTQQCSHEVSCPIGLTTLDGQNVLHSYAAPALESQD